MGSVLIQKIKSIFATYNAKIFAFLVKKVIALVIRKIWTCVGFHIPLCQVQCNCKFGSNACKTCDAWSHD